MLDYYRVLSVSSDIKQSDLKTAYIKRLKQFHPDIYKGNDATDKTQKINEAYQTLKDPAKRARYDQELSLAYAQKRSASANAGSRASSWSRSTNGGFGQQNILSYLTVNFRQRQNVLSAQVQTYLQKTLQKCRHYIDAGADYSSIVRATEREYQSFRSQLLVENVKYYQQYSNTAQSFNDEIQIMRLSALQESYIKNLLQNAWDTISKQLNGYYCEQTLNRKNADFNKILNPFFWAGLAFSLVFPLFIFIAAVLAYIFGKKTADKIFFLTGSFIGLVLKLVFISG